MGKYASRGEKKAANKRKRKRETRKGMRQLRQASAKMFPLKGQMCEKCGFRKAEERHHKSKRVEDVVLLCKKCHQKYTLP